MKETKQILAAIFATSGYTLEDGLRDVGVKPAREEDGPVGQRLLIGRGSILKAVRQHVAMTGRGPKV